MKNKKVVVDNMDAYSWECPECGQLNMHDKYVDAVCDGCGNVFEPIEKSE